MVRRIFRPSGKLFLSILLTAGIACFSVSAFAQPTPAGGGTNVAAGCNAAVWNAMSAKAEAQVAYDSAVTRQMINKPDSVLALTCFSDAAGVSAANGGLIFSGNFTAQLSAIMPVTGGGAYNCTGPGTIGALWNTIATEGINTATPYATFNDLLTGTVPAPSTGAPAAGADFTAGWNAAGTANTFNNLQTTVNALPPQPQALNFSTAKSSCDVLLQAGIIQGSCPAAGSFQAPGAQ